MGSFSSLLWSQLSLTLGTRHYVLDGRLSSIGHLPPSTRHTSNPTRPCSSLILFAAPTAEAWAAIRRAESSLPPPPVFRDVFSTLFSNSPNPAILSFPFPLLSIYVIIEGLQSLVSDFRGAGGIETVGVPSSPALASALTLFLTVIQRSTILPPSNRNDLLVRYHAINITLFTDVPALLSPSSPTPRREWAATPAGRRTMLHAAAIRSLAEARAGGSAGPFHLPSAIYLAAVITHAFLEGTRAVLTGESRFDIASEVDWTAVGNAGVEGEQGEVGEEGARRFILRGGTAFLEGRPVSSLSLHLLASLLRRLGHFWGIAQEFAEQVSNLLDA